SAEMKEIAVAVVEQDGCFLIGQRAADIPLAGMWEFPGGKVQDGEDANVAAIRECLEETGLHVEVVGEYPDVIHDYPHGRLHLRFVQCRPRDAEAMPQLPFEWVARADLTKYEFPPANVALLAQLLKG